MNLKLLYFARVKELINLSGEELIVPSEVDTIIKLKVYLAQRGGVWTELFNGKQLIRAAVNQTLVSDNATINQEDEVAFFPPVTGG